MTIFVGLDVAKKIRPSASSIQRAGRGQCPTLPGQIAAMAPQQAGEDGRIGIETGAPWHRHELRRA